MQIIPVECKAGGNVTSASFKRYRREEKPELAIRFSTLQYKKQEDMINMPLYLACRINKEIKQKILYLGAPRRWLKPPYPVFAKQKLAGRAFRHSAIAPAASLAPYRSLSPVAACGVAPIPSLKNTVQIEQKHGAFLPKTRRLLKKISVCFRTKVGENFGGRQGKTNTFFSFCGIMIAVILGQLFFGGERIV